MRVYLLIYIHEQIQTYTHTDTDLILYYWDLSSSIIYSLSCAYPSIFLSATCSVLFHTLDTLSCPSSPTAGALRCCKRCTLVYLRARVCLRLVQTKCIHTFIYVRVCLCLWTIDGTLAMCVLAHLSLLYLSSLLCSFPLCLFPLFLLFFPTLFISALLILFVSSPLLSFQWYRKRSS